MQYEAITIKPDDNVAMALKVLKPDRVYHVLIGKSSQEITVKELIEYGHKFAVVNIKKGEDILKYGEVIGRATADITVGDHAHIHNIESLRGRGDLTQKGA